MSSYVHDQEWASAGFFLRLDHGALDADLVGERNQMVHGLEKVPVLLPLLVEDKPQNPSKYLSLNI